MQRITWVLEHEVFPNGDCLRSGAEANGHSVVSWRDEWLVDASWPLIEGSVVFHGSLANADLVRRSIPWAPGAYCDTERFACSAWYTGARDYLVHRSWEIMPASELARTRDAVCERFGSDRIFVRPDSPLKPFSGRVLSRENISLAALDHGFYFDDASLPVVVAPVRKIAREWRYVIVEQEVISGSEYLADGRTALLNSDLSSWKYAQRAAKAIDAPDKVFVLDVCECDNALWVIEINPFSGADLYACDGAAITSRIASLLTSQNP